MENDKSSMTRVLKHLFIRIALSIAFQKTIQTIVQCSEKVDELIKDMDEVLDGFDEIPERSELLAGSAF
ncbi:hypothetical protein FHETE_1856 [Fusarium heterosporum]|uniref:Uncharacterized protein n=1 Tax=Fusarium heterosporum TaxID=42747 RepID=A0A8H5X0U8_FUSHE|nr:hypothetical protein FHETE_1856 [Fusarium heterosporum]